MVVEMKNKNLMKSHKNSQCFTIGTELEEWSGMTNYKNQKSSELCCKISLRKSFMPTNMDLTWTN